MGGLNLQNEQSFFSNAGGLPGMAGMVSASVLSVLSDSVYSVGPNTA